MTDEDPRRLKERGDSPELARALNALGRDRDAERLARVAQKLGAALNPPPPTAATSGSALGTKLAAGSIVLGVAVVSLIAYVWTNQPAPTARAPAVPVTPAPSVVPPSRVADVEPEHDSPAAPAVAPRERPAAAKSNSAPAEPQRRAPRTRSAAATPAAGPSEGSNRSASETVAPTDAVRPSSTDSEPREEPAERARREQRSELRPQEAPRARSEAELLFEARKAMVSQPTAALALIAEHAARYPRGQLAPEREVLRIEALRKLGRTAEADRQLREFQSRYPKSIHLRRLGGGAGSTLTP